MTRCPGIASALALVAIAALVAACAGGPQIPDWQGNARSAMDRAIAAYLAGDTGVADVEFERARAEVARTGRPDLLARVELTGCAARVASLVFERCEGFERLEPDADAAERAYANYLAARVLPQDVALLPPQHRAVATANAGAGAAFEGWTSLVDPLSRLVAIGVSFRAGRANPAAIALAVDTASSQGWRRPLLAWLNVALELADKSGNSEAAARLRRRIGVAEGTR